MDFNHRFLVRLALWLDWKVGLREQLLFMSKRSRSEAKDGGSRNGLSEKAASAGVDVENEVHYDRFPLQPPLLGLYLCYSAPSI